MQQTIEYVPSIREYISHVMKNCEAHVVLHEWQRWRGKTQLYIVQKKAAATERKSGERIARTSLIQAEAAMGITATHKKALGKGNLRLIRRWSEPGQGDDCVGKWTFHA